MSGALCTLREPTFSVAARGNPMERAAGAVGSAADGDRLARVVGFEVAGPGAALVQGGFPVRQLDAPVLLQPRAVEPRIQRPLRRGRVVLDRIGVISARRRPSWRNRSAMLQAKPYQEVSPLAVR